MPLQVVTEDDRYNALFLYGENGSGKTHLAFTAPGKKLYIDYAGNPQVRKKFPNEVITVVKGPDRWDDINQMWDDDLIEEHDVVILDNTTQLYRTILEDIIQNIPIKSGEGNRPLAGVPILRDYNFASERLRICARNLVKKVGVKRHVICVGHPQVEKDEDTGTLIGGPALPGKVPAYFISLFPELIFMRASGDKWKAEFTKKTYYPAATRVRNPKEDAENPDLSKLYTWRKVEHPV